MFTDFSERVIAPVLCIFEDTERDGGLRHNGIVDLGMVYRQRILVVLVLRKAVMDDKNYSSDFSWWVKQPNGGR